MFVRRRPHRALLLCLCLVLAPLALLPRAPLAAQSITGTDESTPVMGPLPTAAPFARNAAAPAASPPEVQPTQRMEAPDAASPQAQPLPSRAFASAPQQVAPQQAGGCSATLYNPTLDYGLGWTALVPFVGIDPSVYFSPPHSFALLDGTNASDATPNMDAFGQDFIFPADGQVALIEFKLAYSVTDSADTLFYEFYLVDANGTPTQLVWQGTAPTFNDNEWHNFSDTVQEPTILNPMRGQRVALVVRSETDNLAPFEAVWIDDVQVTVCAGTTAPSGSISGKVTQAGADVSNVQLMLAYTADGGETTVLDTTTPDSNGDYAFTNVNPLPLGGIYQVWYVNDRANAERLSLWAGERISAFSEGQQIQVESFDISNVALDGAEYQTDAALPYTFRWQSRGVPGDRYYLCIYDLQDFTNQACTLSPLTEPNFTVTADILKNASDFQFEYGRPYAWYVYVVGPNFDSAVGAHIGYSFGSKGIIFVEGSIPNTTITPNPPSQRSGAEWTVMVYIAGDNDLSAPNAPDNLREQFETLKRLAGNYPNINLVTLTDFQGDNDTQFCLLLAGTQRCDPAAEKDSADPQVLADFINRSLELYPAPKRMLVISSHGHTIRGVATDFRSGNDLTPLKLRQAFDAAQLNDPARRLDVLYYNNCLMGSLEAAFDARLYARYLVASPNIAWAVDVYPELLAALAAPALQADAGRTVAAGIVDGYSRAMDRKFPGLYVSIAAYDLDKVEPVRNALANLATKFNLNPAASNAIQPTVQRYDSSGDDQLDQRDAFVDLHHLATLLRNNGGNAEISSAAQGVLATLDNNAIIASRQVSGASNCDGNNFNLAQAGGMSVYFPAAAGYQPDELQQYLNAYSSYASGNQWGEYLQVALRQNTPPKAPSKPRSAPIGATVAACAANSPQTKILIPLVRKLP